MFGIAKKLGLCKQSIYCSGDWLANQKKKGSLRWFANDFVWVQTDYFAVIYCDLLINYSIECKKARENRWGKQLSVCEYDRFPPPIDIYNKAFKNQGSYICFIGQVRENSGLQQLLPLLKNLNDNLGIKLKIIGPNITYRKIIEDQIENMAIGNLVELHGWLNQNDLKLVMQECFCGINLLTSESYSDYAIPGKNIQYMQMLIPLLVTSNNNMNSTIKEYKLGYVLNVKLESLHEAILHLFENQKHYRDNIEKYGVLYRSKTITEYLSMIQ